MQAGGLQVETMYLFTPYAAFTLWSHLISLWMPQWFQSYTPGAGLKLQRKLPTRTQLRPAPGFEVSYRRSRICVCLAAENLSRSLATHVAEAPKPSKVCRGLL